MALCGRNRVVPYAWRIFHQQQTARPLHQSYFCNSGQSFHKDESEKENERCKTSFDADFQANNIPISLFQQAFLSIGSAAISLVNPARGDMIATLGETTGTCALQHILQKMEADQEGLEILSKRPRINSRTVDLNKLQAMPENTLGKAYSDFLRVNNVTPDSRAHVQFVDDVELAYVMQRYREVHDLFHTVLQMKTNMLGEVTVKWVEAIQTKLPMCIGGAVLGSVRLAKKQRQQYLSHYLPWAIHTGWDSKFLMNIFFEQRWEQPLNELQKELNIQPLCFK